MDSDYPPLPSSRAIDASLQNISLSDGKGMVHLSSGSGTPISIANGYGQNSCSQPNARVIVDSGDILLEYASAGNALQGTSGPAAHRWRVSSEALVQSSPYFRALLDPDKFSEGRDLMRQRELHGFGVDFNGEVPGSPGYSQAQDALPTIQLPDTHLSPRLGLDTIEFFLRALSFNSFNEEEKINFDAEVRAQRPASVVRLVELADAFNSPQVIRDTLKRSGYTLGKPKLPLTKFNLSMLKLNEDRIRQSMFIANFLNDRTAFQMLTHALIVAGSRSWVNGLDNPAPDSPSWHHFPDDLEEELYYRRQCVLNTITDLQAHFLRVYGALEDPAGPKASNNPPINPLSAASRQYQYQCRCGFGNSSACDAFHLGQMTRFFAVRTKTIFLGSMLIDPDFTPDGEESESDLESGNQPERPNPSTTDITSIISSLKQCPDYQIDSNHTACGIRRRLLPTLDCIEGFVGDERGLLGINLKYWQRGHGEGGSGTQWPHIHGSWANRSLRRALIIDLRLSRISGIPLMSPGTFGAEFREEDARLLFTAKKRNWEA
ncbi:hypothetical protein BDW59DRAFT_102886 [Aspergillus cavernicola]|uniref:BTB domain-containing protein n=1 Tax=Aspergillus cavernicola TaxID=176166 RepID=A0ABR4I3K5_9EURO